MKFTKMQGAGNDYIFIDARDESLALTDWPSISRSMSDRHFGVGGDGIILFLASQAADLKMRMFNADGSEGEMCGNGIRCFVKHAVDREMVPAGSSPVRVETLSGIRDIEPVLEGNTVVRAKVAMGAPRLAPAEVPVELADGAGERVSGAVVNYPLEIGEAHLKLSFVSMGNPHAVAFLEEPVDRFPLHVLGPQVEHHPMFPNRVNFEIVNLAGDGRLTARVWERGSGETMACGTGACAIGVASRILGHTSDVVDITLPGGTLNVSWDGRGQVYLEGDAVEVFRGEWIQ